MIDRYTTPEMAQIWSEQNKFETWKKVEITVTEVLSDRGEVPKEAVKVINEKAAFSVDRILEIEKVTRHDVIAFLTNMAENIGSFIESNKKLAEAVEKKTENRNKLLDKKAFTIAGNPKKTYLPPKRLSVVPDFDFSPLDESHKRLEASAWKY